MTSEQSNANDDKSTTDAPDDSKKKPDPATGEGKPENTKSPTGAPDDSNQVTAPATGEGKPENTKSPAGAPDDSKKVTAPATAKDKPETTKSPAGAPDASKKVTAPTTGEGKPENTKSPAGAPDASKKVPGQATVEGKPENTKSPAGAPDDSKKVPAPETAKDKAEATKALNQDERVKRLFRLYVNRRSEKTDISINGYTMKADVYSKDKVKLNRVKSEENRYLTDRTDKKFMFWITIPSVCYLGKITVPTPDGKGTLTLTFKEGEDMIKYFRHIHRQQLGQHVFVTHNGCIGTIGTYLDKGGPYVCTTGNAISSLYPCIQNHFKEKDDSYQEVQNELVLGLSFMEYLDTWTWFPATEMKKHPPNDKKGPFFHQIGQDHFRLDHKAYRFRKRNRTEDEIKKGQRYYSRFSDHNHPTNTGNVHEITEKYLEVLYFERQSVDANDVRFAVYVCSGAKLLVQDNYHEFPVIRKFEKSKHNRSLVLQGGLVMVQGKGSEVSFNLPFHLSFHDLKRRKPTPLFNASLEQLVQLMTDLEMSAVNKQKIRTIKRPVIFIGANESDYDTICWKLEVERDSLTANTKPVDNTITLGRFCALTIPEGGRIVAIEEWSEGIEEVWCRHRYEQLYQSVVSLKDDNDFSYSRYAFTTPNSELMLRKILGVESESRVIESNLKEIPVIRKFIESRPQSHIQPVEFNFYRPSLVLDQIGPLINLKHCRPFAHPAYPPIEFSAAQKTLYYPPAKLEFGGQVFPLDPVHEYYHLDKNFRTKSHCLKYQKFEFDLDQIMIPEYIWKRYTGETTESGQPVDRVVNDLKYRLGCDGCYYQKTEQPIGKFKTLYYKLVQSQDGGTDKQIEQKIVKTVD